MWIEGEGIGNFDWICFSLTKETFRFHSATCSCILVLREEVWAGDVHRLALLLKSLKRWVWGQTPIILYVVYRTGYNSTACGGGGGPDGPADQFLVAL